MLLEDFLQYTENFVFNAKNLCYFRCSVFSTFGPATLGLFRRLVFVVQFFDIQSFFDVQSDNVHVSNIQSSDVEYGDDDDSPATLSPTPLGMAMFSTLTFSLPVGESRSYN
jgi:hypothetical protein